MDDRENTNRLSTQVQSQAAKKAYEKPRIVYRAPLEVMAGICDEASGGKAVPGPQCTNLTS